MKKSLFNSHKEIIKSLRLITEQEDDEYYKISAEELEELIEYSSDSISVTRLPKFKGKKLYVTGNLDLSDTKIKTLGNIGYVDGSLNITGTQISSTHGTTVKGYIHDYRTPRERIRIQQELQKKKDEQHELRKDKDWDLSNPNIDDIGLKANALYQYLIDDNIIEEKSIDEEEANRIKKELEILQKRYDEEEDPEVYNKIYDQISDLESELEDMKPEMDIYDLSPTRYTFYGLTQFEILNYDHKNEEYTVGTSREMDDAMEEYFENYVNDVGLDGFNESTLERCLDEDSIKSMLEEYYEDDVRDNPESYFSESDFQYTEEQEQRMEQLEKYINEMKTLKDEVESQQSEIEDSDSEEYNQLQEKIDEIEENIEKAEDELTETEPDKEPTEDMINEKVEELVSDDMDDPLRVLKNWGYNVKDYIDERELVRILIQDGDWGDMNGYNGDYTSVDINNKTYYVMRVS